MLVALSVGGALGAMTYAVSAVGGPQWGLVLGFAALALLCEQFPIPFRHGGFYSVTFVVLMAALVVGGPATAGLAAAIGSLSLLRKEMRSQPPVKHLFNTAQLTLVTTLAGLVYWATGGPVAESPGALIPDALLPLGAAAAVNFATNTLLVSAAVSFSSGMSITWIWREQARTLIPGYVAFGALGLLLAALFLTPMRWGSTIFLLVPLLVARRAFQAAVTFQGAFDETTRTLVAAVEAKDPYTAGHAERVAKLAEMVARHHGLPAEQARRIHYAALMHDIGKLVVATRVLRKAGRLTPDEYEHMRTHPAHGEEIVAGIDLLASVVDGIKHHHERVDGAGYPNGLAGRDIPLTARIIMVADAFDAMTSTRAYRPPKRIDEAFEELHRCAGTQFDPPLIDALEKAIAANGWEPAPEIRRGLNSPLDAGTLGADRRTPRDQRDVSAASW